MQTPVNFVVPYADEIISNLRDASPDDIARSGRGPAMLLAAGGPAAWCYLTFRRLQMSGYGGISLSNKIDRCAINIVHSEQLAFMRYKGQAFIVSAQADHARRLGAQFHIVQNRDQLTTNSVWIHHWPQPGLFPRTTPIVGLRRVAYIGQTYNGNLALDETAWRAKCLAAGFEFHAPDSCNWHDFSRYDACIAIRSFDRRTYRNKPASKLINAWHAGVPLIAGHDSAYRQIGSPGEDYLIASTMSETLECLNRLDRDPDFRSGMIARGQRKGAKFSDEQIVKLWIEAIEGPLQERFKLWRSRPGLELVRHSALTALDRGLIMSKAAASQHGLQVWRP